VESESRRSSSTSTGEGTVRPDPGPSLRCGRWRDLQDAALREASLRSPHRRARFIAQSRHGDPQYTPLSGGALSSGRRLDGGVTWPATVLTLYPEMFPGPLGSSLAGRALE